MTSVRWKKRETKIKKREFLSTNDFTNEYKQQITANQTAISNIKDGTTIDSFGDVETALSGKEDKSNKVTSISSESTNTQYPSAKLLYDKLAEKQTEIDNLQTDVEDLRNASYKVPGTGTDITLNNTAKGRLLKNDLSGRTEQEQLSGKNLFDISTVSFDKTGSSIIDGDTIKNIYGLYNYSIKVMTSKTFNVGTYTISGKVMVSSQCPDKRFVVGFWGNTATKSVTSYDTWENFSESIVLTENKDGFVFQGLGNASNYLNLDVRFKDIQVETGSTATSYEPYCRTEYQAQAQTFHSKLKM